MQPDFVSVIVPTYNYGRFISEAVDSALAQTYPHREVIVVDDGSTDDTREVLEPYGGRIRYIHQANGGLSAARNTGIRASKGNFIALLDADDLWHPRKLEVQMNYLREHPEIHLLGSDLITDRTQIWPELEEVFGEQAERVTLEEVVGTARFAPSSAVIRRRSLLEAGLFDDSLRCVEDRDMWIRLAKDFTLAKLPLPLVWYRYHPQSLSQKAPQMEEAELRVLQRAFQDVPALRGRFFLWRKTLGRAAFSSAQLFGINEQWPQAVARIVRSFWLWPLPYSRRDMGSSLVRLRTLVVYVLRWLGVARRDPNRVSNR